MHAKRDNVPTESRGASACWFGRRVESPPIVDELRQAAKAAVDIQATGGHGRERAVRARRTVGHQPVKRSLGGSR